MFGVTVAHRKCLLWPPQVLVGVVPGSVSIPKATVRNTQDGQTSDLDAVIKMRDYRPLKQLTGPECVRWTPSPEKIFFHPRWRWTLPHCFSEQVTVANHTGRGCGFDCGCGCFPYRSCEAEKKHNKDKDVSHIPAHTHTNTHTLRCKHKGTH